MAFTVFQADELAFEPRSETDARSIASLSEALSDSRANVWRYPPGAQGKRHRDLGQEEVFVVLDGTLTVERGTILQLRNVGEEELVLFIYGAPPETGQAEFFDPVP